MLFKWAHSPEKRARNQCANTRQGEDTEEEEESKGAASIALGFTCTFREEAIVSTLNAMSDEMLELDILH